MHNGGGIKSQVGRSGAERNEWRERMREEVK